MHAAWCFVCVCLHHRNDFSVYKYCVYTEIAEKESVSPQPPRMDRWSAKDSLSLSRSMYTQNTYTRRARERERERARARYRILIKLCIHKEIRFSDALHILCILKRQVKTFIKLGVLSK